MKENKLFKKYFLFYFLFIFSLIVRANVKQLTNLLKLELNGCLSTSRSEKTHTDNFLNLRTYQYLHNLNIQTAKAI